MNYSGTIESNDVTLLSNYLASYDVITLSNIQIYLADVNNDGVINSRDLAALNRLAS